MESGYVGVQLSSLKPTCFRYCVYFFCHLVLLPVSVPLPFNTLWTAFPDLVFLRHSEPGLTCFDDESRLRGLSTKMTIQSVRADIARFRLV